MRLSNSRINNFKVCPKKYEWCYIENLVQKVTPRPLELGGLFHDILAYHSLKREDEALNLAKTDPEAEKLYQAYLREFPTEQFTTIAVERFFEVDLEEGFSYVVKGDKFIRFRNLLMLFDTKTMAKEDQRSINKEINGPQIKGYIWGMQKILKEKVNGCLWDFVIKTKIPGFRRIPQLYSQKELDLWFESTMDWAREIQHCTNQEHFRRNLSACYTFMGQCEYIPLCLVGPDTPELRDSLYNAREEVNPSKKLL